MSDPGPATDTLREVSLHSSWRGLVAAYLGAALVLGCGVLALIAVGPTVISVAFTVLGSALMLGVLLDVPIASRFAPAGIERRALLRHSTLSWDRVSSLTRTRPTLQLSARRLGLGGLVAVAGRRRYLLVDRVEAATEFDAVVDLVERVAPGCDVDGLLRPGPEVPPTWISRRSRWRPVEARRR